MHVVSLNWLPLMIHVKSFKCHLDQSLVISRCVKFPRSIQKVLSVLREIYAIKFTNKSFPSPLQSNSYHLITEMFGNVWNVI